MGEKLLSVARYIAKANAPHEIKVSIVRAVDKFLRGEMSEKTVKLYLASLLKFGYDPNWWIERHVMRMLGFEVDYPPTRFSKPTTPSTIEEVKEILKDSGIEERDLKCKE